jgi:two-component system chemotaxis sensor kinase CheA
MVSYIYNRAAGMKVVGSAADIARNGRPIERQSMRPGDLVFFNTLNRSYSHVGIYLGDQRFILPTLSVRESFRPTPAMISTVHQRGEMVNVRGRLCPLLRLHRHFDIAPQTEDPAQAIIIVLESNHELRCLMVDQLLGKQEVVIKSLGETFKASHALAGAAILGDGRVGLILDVNNLIHLGNGTFNGTAAPVHQEVAALA